MRYDLGESIIVFAIIGFLCLIPLSLYNVVRQTSVERQCLKHGYPNGTFRFIGDSYCVKRVNQTDTVVSLQALDKH